MLLKIFYIHYNKIIEIIKTCEIKVFVEFIHFYGIYFKFRLKSKICRYEIFEYVGMEIFDNIK